MSTRYSPEEIEVFGAEALGIDPAEYQEIVGAWDRPSRGGTDLVGAAQVLSSLKAGGVASNVIQRRAAAQRPAVRGVPLTRMYDTQVPIVVFGTLNQTPTATVKLEQHFKPERLVVTEQNNGNGFFNPAQSQILTGAFVGAMNMFPTAPGVGSGIHCGVFATNGQGLGINWATAKPAVSISLQVNFLAIGTFWGTMLGKTIC